MQAPKCRICATNHWSQEPCTFPDAKPSVYQKGVASEVKTATETIAVKTSTPTEMISVPKVEYDMLRAHYDKQKERNRKAMQKRRAKKSTN